MELLETREAKYSQVDKHGHAFGRKHNIYFNPYSKDRQSVKYYAPIRQPEGKMGRGGFQLFKAIGLCNDYESYNDILAVFCAGLALHPPSHIVLEPGKTYKLKHYGYGARQQIGDFVIKAWPFFQHFCNSNGDNWAIPMMIAQAIEKSTTNTKEGTKRTIRRRIKKTAIKKEGGEEGEAGEAEDTGEVGEAGEESEEDYANNDYAAKTLAHQAAAKANNNRNKSQPHSNNNHRQKPARPANPPRPQTTSHPAQPTSTD
ncbi:hypothetical protein RhiJN_05222 [Ceratobasidium sp. AG-Ba]|nr:hypothetical protein RhiJN_05222 [Ceratobasidium sp. AG-Ba]QRW06139.1 hypothetical protein RhiLY_05138 [Ceratobasidium sp. AG-Ba]